MSRHQWGSVSTRDVVDAWRAAQRPGATVADVVELQRRLSRFSTIYDTTPEMVREWRKRNAKASGMVAMDTQCPRCGEFYADMRRRWFRGVRPKCAGCGGWRDVADGGLSLATAGGGELSNAD